MADYRFVVREMAANISTPMLRQILAHMIELREYAVSQSDNVALHFIAGALAIMGGELATREQTESQQK